MTCSLAFTSNSYFSLIDDSSFTPNIVSGPGNVQLSIIRNEPIEEYVYFGFYAKDDFSGLFGAIKGLIIVCGKEKLKLKMTQAIEKNFVTQDKVEEFKMSDLFDIDITNTI